METTLIDSGPLVALLDARDKHHMSCRTLLGDTILPWTTTVACLTETLYLIGKAGGFAAQGALWQLISAGVLEVADSFENDLMSAWTYMTRFKDVPCDFADATLLALADRIGARRVITLDRHFYAYQVGDLHLKVLP